MIWGADESNASGLRGTFIGIVSVGVLALGYNFYNVYETSKELKEKKRKFNLEIIHPVISYVDKDSNGLSFSENYEIKKLMGIQDSSKNYTPTYEDWKRAYEKFHGRVLK